MYTTKNFKTKKELKEAVDNFNRCQANPSEVRHTPITVYQPGPFARKPRNGTVFLEGPHYPEPHRWYAEAELRDGIVVKVK